MSNMSNKCGCSIMDNENGAFFVYLIIGIFCLFLISAFLTYVGSAVDSKKMKDVTDTRATLICKDRGGVLNNVIKNDTVITICNDGHVKTTKL